MPSVSIIIPAYNSSATIVAALESVVTQTVRDVEVIVVDDASSDDTVQTVRRWAVDRGDVTLETVQARAAVSDTESPPVANDCGADVLVRLNRAEPVTRRVGTPAPHFREAGSAQRRLSVISLPRNSGPAAARNHGIAQATGDWIAFLDADDLWPRARLDIQLQAAAADPEVVLWCGRAVRFDADRHEEQAAALRDVTSEATASAALRRLVLDEFALHNPVATSTVLVRRAVLQACGGFDEQFRGPEDYDLWMRVVSNGPAAFLEADLAWYAQRQGSLSMDDRTFLPQVIRVLDKAFAPGGALHGRRDLRRRALANQYWNASWMAFQRGARGGALRHLAQAVLLQPGVGGCRQLPLWWRYLRGSREVGD
jgi:glycosyltransferase involved in cell wall biosynthesis